MTLSEMMEALREAHKDKARFYSILLAEVEVKPILDEYDALITKQTDQGPRHA